MYEKLLLQSLILWLNLKYLGHYFKSLMVFILQDNNTYFDPTLWSTSWVSIQQVIQYGKNLAKYFWHFWVSDGNQEKNCQQIQ